MLNSATIIGRRDVAFIILALHICFFITILPLTLLAMETKEILEATCEALLLMPDLYI